MVFNRLADSGSKQGVLVCVYCQTAGTRISGLSGIARMPYPFVSMKVDRTGISPRLVPPCLAARLSSGAHRKAHGLGARGGIRKEQPGIAACAPA